MVLFQAFTENFTNVEIIFKSFPNNGLLKATSQDSLDKTANSFCTDK